ncbi:GFA family protein [Shewanella sp. MMG014]|uniref:GFA family protein n=1 Tax=Shewanella sp. MMG014 TaxID=2822691 RepID=UPI001B38AB0D|nr:GFA family protein [Shewanella sp. MMG014]MBQ4889625.1 GFA family protein [Shewanella sp. MMG014]
MSDNHINTEEKETPSNQDVTGSEQSRGSDDFIHQGGCLCGAIRYQITHRPFDADYCHCSQCQKSSGAVFQAWMDFKVEQVEWIAGKPVEFASSEHVRRGFCQQCGCTISFRDTRHPGYYTLTIGSLDNPNLIHPNYHIHTANQVSWLNILDTCERYPLDRS